MSKSQTPRKLARPELPREFAGNLAQFQSFLEAVPKLGCDEAPAQSIPMDYTEEETIARAEAALKRMLATPHQPHKEMKIGRRKRVLELSKKRKREI